MRILIDYRPALRQRTGVGEYIHELTRTLVQRGTDEVTVFTSSWTDRASPDLSATIGARVVDRHIPGALLNALWHRGGWPPVEWLAGAADVVHAAHPLLIPARRAAQVVTIHDLFFLTSSAGMATEIRRDYPRLTAAHAQRAHAVITSSEYGRSQIVTRLAVPSERIHVVSPGMPTWRTLGSAPHVPTDGYVLFVGTLERRKNIGALLDAWAQVVAALPAPPRLVLAGRSTPEAATWLARLRDPAMRGTAEHRGYVPHSQREALYAGARILILPSLDEGFGLPVLEAMSAGIPVVAADRGAMPEVTAGAAELIDPTRVETISAALVRLLTDTAHAHALAAQGLTRARDFTWTRAADAAHTAYADALARSRTGRGDR